MGSQLSILQLNSHRKNNNPLLGLSLSKLCDTMASFKSICESFALDLSHFQKIFNVNENHFVIWDTDNNGLIDALELFSGMAVFSSAKFEDIIRFLFDLFDLNEVNSLCKIDVEFMMFSCMSSAYKIYNINEENH
jgi:hypothetical protein